MKAVLQDAFSKAGAAGKHPKHFLFFSQTKDGQLAADAFLARLNERTEDRDAAVSNEMVQAQLAAITAWGQQKGSNLHLLQHPVFVANGDRTLWLRQSTRLNWRVSYPQSQLSIFPDAGHDGIFQYHAVFVQQTLALLR